MEIADRFRGCLLGLAAGDAVGTTVEFRPRGTFQPLTDMTGGGPFHLKPGQWTDDTSMALCLAVSLLEKNGFDPRDQMERYWRWYREGYLSSTGRCFDIGGATRAALHRYHETGEPYSGSTDKFSAGNGSIMRLAPVVLFFYPDAEAVLHFAAESSRTTHAAVECVEACQIMANILDHLLRGEDKKAALLAPLTTALTSAALLEIAQGSYLTSPESQIQGSGYVVKSLEAALWCFWNSDSFEHAVLKAANLGDDADTTAAVCGQFAGAYYGVEGIPAPWLDQLSMRPEIETLADRLRQNDPLV